MTPRIADRAPRGLNVCRASIIGLLLTVLGCAGLGACQAQSGSPAPADAATRAAERQQSAAISGAVPFDAHLLVDQFGYRPQDTKVAVVRNPQQGYDAADRYLPGTRFEVRRADDHVSVFSAEAQPWNGGAVDPSAGDQGWWIDFSALHDPGRYYLIDIERQKRSAAFRIADDVYRDLLKAATRSFYYQRAGTAKLAMHAGSCWADGPAFLGAQQDGQARDITDRGNSAKLRDLSGGWFDAGDSNKYVTFAAQPLHLLLNSYQDHPTLFTDDFNIPESGNGIPDLLDEIRWELAWLKKMQNADGSSALKVGNIKYSSATPPSTDRSERYYIPRCSSATIVSAGVFAHAAQLFSSVPGLERESMELTARAVRAWDQFHGAGLRQTDCDSQEIHAGDADLSAAEQDAQAVVAAVYLAAVTGLPKYQDYVARHYRDTRPYRDFGWSRYMAEQGEALLFHARQTYVDPALRQQLLADKRADAERGNRLYRFAANDDLYRAYLHPEQYHWGSNQVRAAYGSSNLDVVKHALDPQRAAEYELRAAEILHYFHGVNPFGRVYLSNTYSLGATRSVNQIFHFWFRDNSRWDDALSSECGPPPGFITGGPVARAEAQGVPATISPPAGQPPQKSFLDWNGDYPEQSYVINEPAIYYQAAYLRLLAAFAE